MDFKEDINDRNLDELHKKNLGLSVPKNYFSTSKNELLEKIASKKKTKVIPFYQKKLVWFTAACIALLVALTVFNPTITSNFNKTTTIVSDTLNNIENIDLIQDLFITDSQDIMVASLFMDDTEISNYIVNNIIEELIIDEEIDYFILENLMPEESNLN
jgi:hypothetical protein